MALFISIPLTDMAAQEGSFMTAVPGVFTVRNDFQIIW